jgi:hypothetical protein
MFMRASLSALVLLASLLSGGAANSAEQIDLSPAKTRSTASRVTIDLTAGGHTLVRAATEDEKQASEQKLPMSVAAKIEYDERSLPPNETQNRSLVAVRHYRNAEAVLKAGESGRTPRLADDRRLIAVEISDGDCTDLYSPNGPLLREQLDLIDIVGNSAITDRLLPSYPVANGDTWAHDASLMCAFLALDSVAVCEVQSVLDEHNANFAKVRLAGVVHGMADGAATELDVRALYLFDRRQQRVTKLNLAVREKRSIGGATPGLDAVAKLQMNIEPIESSPELSDAAVAKVAGAERVPSQSVLYEAAPLGFRIRHDRQWFVTSEQRESITFRRVDRGDLVAQCTLTMLPPKSAGRQVSLEQFQKDMTYSLGKNFGELVSSRQWQNAAGHYCFEVVARGMVEEVPVEWHYFLVAPESGHRVSVAVTIEKPMIERAGEFDRELVESLQLFPRMPAASTASHSASEARTQ